MTSEEIPDRNAFLDKLRKQFPNIRPYGEEDWDWTWADEGHELLEAEDFVAAERKFQELIASQPDHPDGYEGLALVYKAIERFPESEILIEEAVRLSAALVEKDHMDREVLAEILEERDEIRALKQKYAPREH
jgi:tetratricopeptide (TPR) repeat protein